MVQEFEAWAKQLRTVISMRPESTSGLQADFHQSYHEGGIK